MKGEFRLPRVGLGTAPLGWLYHTVTAQQAIDTVRAAVTGGIRYLDTAPHYGLGVAERRLGAALSTVSRDELLISTKVGRLLRPDVGGAREFPGAPPLRRVVDWSRDGIRRSLEESLSRLGQDHVDVALLHDPDDYEQEVYDTAFDAMDELRTEGTVRAIGAGMNQAPMLTRFVERLDLDVVLLAGRYTLLDQEALGNLLPACVRNDVAVVIGGAFNSGILANPQPGAPYNGVPAGSEVLRRAQHLNDLCRQHGVPLPAAALQFPLGHPAVSTVLIGMRSPDEVDQDLRHLNTPIPAAAWSALKTEGLLLAEAPTPPGA